jgi:hypothetical protein
MPFFEVDGPDLWGDYGSILIHGMTAHLPRKDNQLQLERTGPFVPPISFPGVGDVIVTDEFRRELAESPFTHLEFRSIIKARIVKYNWEKWDRTAAEPEEFPESGEPEDYVLARPHSAKIANELGNLWQVLLPEGATVSPETRPGSWRSDLRVTLSTWNGNHLFWGKKRSTDEGSWIIVSELGKTWLESRASEWLRFDALLEK